MASPLTWTWTRARQCKVDCLELQQSFLQFQTSHLFRVQVRGKPNDFVASTLDQRSISSVRLWRKPKFLTGQHRMRLTPDPDRGTNTKITFAIVLDHSSKVINGRQPIGLLNDMVREVQRILMGTEPEFSSPQIDLIQGNRRRLFRLQLYLRNLSNI